MSGGGIMLQKRIIVHVMINVLLFGIGSIIFAQGGNNPVPAYQSEPWVATGGPIGGLGYDIRYCFDDYDRWYVTDAWAGFFISEDRGITWRSSNTGITARKGLDAIPVFSTAVDPHNPNIIWIGMDSSTDDAIFRSTDYGESWTLRDNGVDQTNLTFRGFTIHPNNSNIVYAMAELGSAGWTPDGDPREGFGFDLTMGCVFKTENGGEDWVEIWRGDNLARYCLIHPENPETLYVSTGIFDREAANTDTTANIPGGVGILKSTDGGDTWRVFNEQNGLNDLYVGSLAMHPDNPELLLAATGHDHWSGYQGRETGGVFMTTNGGELWTKILPKLGDTHEIMLVVEYSLVNPNIAYAFSSEAAYRSDDGGFTWQRFTTGENYWGPPGNIIGFPIDAQCDPEDPMRVIVNSYLGGNTVSVDGGVTWLEASRGYTGALVHHLVSVPGQNGSAYAGSRSGIYKTTNGGTRWEGVVYPPQGMWANFNEIIGLAVDHSNPNHLLTLPNDFATILVSENGGQDWTISTMIGRCLALEFAPSDGNIAFAASDRGFYLSIDRGFHFSLINNDALSKQITALAVHPTNSDILWAMTENAGFIASDDAGRSWTQKGTGLPDLAGEALAVHPANLNLMFLGINEESELGGQGLFRSLDGGTTWTQLVAGLEPNAEIKDVVVDPTDTEIAYCCDHLSGVYATTNMGDTWLAINSGLTHRTMNVLALSDDGSVLYAGTEGGGIYRLGAVTGTGIDRSLHRGPNHIQLAPNFPNPFNPETTIQYHLPAVSHVKLEIRNLKGEAIRVLIEEIKQAGHYSVRWDGRDTRGVSVPSGVYIYQIKSAHGVESRKLTLIR